MKYNYYYVVNSYIEVFVEADNEDAAEEIAIEMLQNMPGDEYDRQVLLNAEVDIHLERQEVLNC